MKDLDPAAFDDALASDTPLVVDFWAPWCRPCKAIGPILEELEAGAGGRVAFAKVNVDDFPEISGRFDILSIPTVILFAGGEAKQRVIGIRPRAQFEQAFADWLAPAG